MNMRLQLLRPSRIDIVERQESWNIKCLPEAPCERCLEDREEDGSSIVFFGGNPLLSGAVSFEGDRHLTVEEVNKMLQKKYGTPGIYVVSFKPTRAHCLENQGRSYYVHVAGKIICEIGFRTIDDYLTFDECVRRPWRVIIKKKKKINTIWKKCPQCCHKLTT